MVPVNSTWLESVFIVMQSSSERGSERNEKIFFRFPLSPCFHSRNAEVHGALEVCHPIRCFRHLPNTSAILCCSPFQLSGAFPARTTWCLRVTWVSMRMETNTLKDPVQEACVGRRYKTTKMVQAGLESPNLSTPRHNAFFPSRVQRAFLGLTIRKHDVF